MEVNLPNLRWWLALSVVGSVACSSSRNTESHANLATIEITKVGPLSGSTPTRGQDDPCAEIALALRSVPVLGLDPQTSGTLDTLWPAFPQLRGRTACLLSAHADSLTSAATVDTILMRLDSAGWSSRTAFDADGPDGTLVGLQRGPTTCVLEGRWDSGNDEDTTQLPGRWVAIRVGCTPTIPSDTAGLSRVRVGAIPMTSSAA